MTSSQWWLSHERLNMVLNINIYKFKAEIYLGIQTQAGVVFNFQPRWKSPSSLFSYLGLEIQPLVSGNPSNEKLLA